MATIQTLKFRLEEGDDDDDDHTPFEKDRHGDLFRAHYRMIGDNSVRVELWNWGQQTVQGGHMYKYEANLVTGYDGYSIDGDVVGSADIHSRVLPSDLPEFLDLKIMVPIGSSPNFMDHAPVTIIQVGDQKVGALPMCTITDVCAICLDRGLRADIWAEMPCRHKYHLSCIARWAAKGRPESQTCPECRTRFNYLKIPICADTVHGDAIFPQNAGARPKTKQKNKQVAVRPLSSPRKKAVVKKKKASTRKSK